MYHSGAINRNRIAQRNTLTSFSPSSVRKLEHPQAIGETAMRLKDKIAIVVGAGQSPGEGMGNGRATVLRFVEEGAKVLAVDNNVSSAEETAAMARARDGECLAFEADVCNEKTLA